MDRKSYISVYIMVPFKYNEHKYTYQYLFMTVKWIDNVES